MGPAAFYSAVIDPECRSVQAGGNVRFEPTEGDKAVELDSVRHLRLGHLESLRGVGGLLGILSRRSIYLQNMRLTTFMVQYCRCDKHCCSKQYLSHAMPRVITSVRGSVAPKMESDSSPLH